MSVLLSLRTSPISTSYGSYKQWITQTITVNNARSINVSYRETCVFRRIQLAYHCLPPPSCGGIPRQWSDNMCLWFTMSLCTLCTYLTGHFILLYTRWHGQILSSCFSVYHSRLYSYPSYRGGLASIRGLTQEARGPVSSDDIYCVDGMCNKTMACSKQCCYIPATPDFSSLTGVTRLTVVTLT